MFLPIGDNIHRRTIPFIPAALVIANVLVFAGQSRIVNTHPDGLEAGLKAEYEFVLNWGLIPSELADGKVLGVLSHMFLHGDFMHILGNMIVLWAFACSLEVGLGRWTLLGFYVLFGLAGGLAHAAIDFSSEIPLIGASGAIAGLIGAYTVLYGPTSKIKTLVFLFYRVWIVEIPAIAFGFGWFLMQLAEASLSDAVGGSGVAWYAHIGGFLAGIAIAFVCRNDTKADLTIDLYGNIAFGEGNGGSEEELVTMMAAPSVCPYCHTDMSDDNQMAENLSRCPNAACQRLVGWEEVQVQQPVGAS